MAERGENGNDEPTRAWPDYVGGRLAGNAGAGAWNGLISGDRCSGTWQATRT